MLLYFEVGGFLSFNEPQIIYLTSSPGARLVGSKYEYNFIISSENKKPRIMKSAVLFGDNASGKTNWFYAIQSFKNIIKHGLEKDFIDNFNIESDTISFSIGVLNYSSDDTFEYSLRFNKKYEIISEEFLCNDKEIFIFKDNILTLREGIKKKEELESLFNTIVSTDTFLSKLEDFIPDYIKKFINCMDDICVVTESPFNEEIKYMPQLRLIDEDDKKVIDSYKEEVIEILSDLDPTIDDFDYTKRESNKKIGYDFVIKRDNHKFDISYESQGIRKIVNLITDILKIFNGKTILIDELDSSIGTKALIRIFNNIVNSKRNSEGQFIISSHNLLLMDFESFHACQMYIFSKGDNYQTYVRSLVDFDLRVERKNLPKFYLNGSFEVY